MSDEQNPLAGERVAAPFFGLPVMPIPRTPAVRSIAQLRPDTPIALVLGGRPGDPVAFVSGTLQELARALAPLLAVEAIRVGVTKLEPESGDLTVLTCAADWLRDNATTLSRFWDDMVPGRALITLADGASIQTLTPHPDGLRNLARALRPILDELEAEEASR